MKRQFNNLSAKAYFGVKNAINNFKNEEEGMEVVQMVLLTVLGLVIVGVLWTVINGYLTDAWSKLDGVEFGDISAPAGE